MKTDLFDYTLPPELIAQAPAPSRSESRLLVLNRSNNGLSDCHFAELGRFLRAGDCLVLNDTKVLPARFFAQRQTGALLEGLFLTEQAGASDTWEVMLKGARKVKPGERIRILNRSQKVGTARHLSQDGDIGVQCTPYYEAKLIEKREGGVCILKVDSERRAEDILDEVGFPPLPPYIRRDGDVEQAREDRQRYQTVYACRPGAVAAPTAGLHFTEPLLVQLQQLGIRLASVTLHVGAGTFKPVTAENLEDHEIHHEWYEIDAENASTINETKASGGRVIAVGTTATRVLETVASGPHISPSNGTTGLFIAPGYEFKMVDVMITNFHLPRSTLLALVAAFAGLDATLAAYRHAVEQRYRFYSYGDAMLIL